MKDAHEGTEWLWVIGGGLLQVPVVAEAHKKGLRVVLSDGNPKCACRNLPDMFLHIDIFDSEGHKSAYNQFKNQKIGFIGGVVAIGIDAPMTCSALNEHIFGKVHAEYVCASSEIAMICHHKNQFRKVMGWLGEPSPDWAIICPDQDSFSIKKVWDQFSGPVIVKPAVNSASRGMTIFHETDTQYRDKPGFFDAVIKAREASRNRIVVVEDLLNIQKEFTVETFFQNEAFYPVFVTERRMKGNLETGLYTPPDIPEMIVREMYFIAHDLGIKLGIKSGPLKLDMALTKSGLYVLEATTRWSGGFDCQYLVPAATGINVIDIAIDLARCRPIARERLFHTKNEVAVSISLWPKEGTRIKRISYEAVLNMPGIKHVFWRYKEGDLIEKYEDCSKRVCFIIATGTSYVDAFNNANNAANVINVEVEEIENE